MAPSESEKNSSRSRALILHSALRLFSERGYDGTSIDDIRQAAGFKSKASLYTHFKSKEEVAAALFNEILEEEDRVLMQAYATAKPEPLDQLLAMGRAYIEWGLSHPQEHAFCFVRAQLEVLIQGKPAPFMRESRPASEELLLKLIQDLRQGYPVRQIADAALLSLAMGMINRAIIDQSAFGAVSQQIRVQQTIDVCMGVLFTEAISLPA